MDHGDLGDGRRLPEKSYQGSAGNPTTSSQHPRQEIFLLISQVLDGLADPSNPLFNRCLQLLQSLQQVWQGVGCSAVVWDVRGKSMHLSCYHHSCPALICALPDQMILKIKCYMLAMDFDPEPPPTRPDDVLCVFTGSLLSCIKCVGGGW